MSEINGEDLAKQIDLSILQLQQILQGLSPKDLRQPHIQLLESKIKIKIAYFQTAANRVRFQNQSNAALKQLSTHFSQTFSQIVKEAYRLLQLKGCQGGSQKLKRKINFLNQMECEMNNQWQGGAKDKENTFLKRIDENTTTIANHVDQTRLKSIAKECLNKEFLAIRMVAYRMYEKYTTHTHSQALEQMQKIRQEHEQMSRQIEELNEFNKTMRLQEKRLIRELNELKRTNEHIGNRYFTSASAAKDM